MISTIMTTYNEEECWIEQAIQSILDQDYENIEVVIVHDNPQNDSIPRFIREKYGNEKRVTLLRNTQNLGLALSLNRGLKVAKGSYIARMDSDDISLSNRFSKEVDFLERNPDFAGVGSNVRYIDEQGNELGISSYIECDFQRIKDLLRNENVFKHPTMMFRKEFLQSVGGYNDINPSQDYELFSRAILLGFKLTNINEELLLYRLRRNSISNSKALLQLIHADYIQKLYKGRETFSKERLVAFEDKMKKKEAHFDYSQKYYYRALSSKDRESYITYIFNLFMAACLSRYRRKTLIRSLLNKVRH